MFKLSQRRWTSGFVENMNFKQALSALKALLRGHLHGAAEKSRPFKPIRIS
jgi:hypothetical protein